MTECTLPGTFVAFEGRDGAGKTTVVHELADLLRTHGYSVVTTKLPTERVRDSDMFQQFAYERKWDKVDALALQVLHMADRLQHTFGFITPRLAEGKVVITDRYLTPSIGALLTRQLPADWFLDLCPRLWRPHAWVMLHARPDIAIARIRSRRNDVDIGITEDEYRRSFEVGLAVAQSNGMRLLDTSDCLPSECAQYVRDVLLHFRLRGSAST